MPSPPVPRRFDFRFDPSYRRVARVFGITPQRAWVEVNDDTFITRFGPWRLRTELANVASWSITGPYGFLKTAGPARLAITDRGLTFATNREQGLLICFRTPVKGLEPLGLLRHPELTVTVSDPPALAAFLAARR